MKNIALALSLIALPFLLAAQCGQWQSVPSGTTMLLRSVHFADVQNGWVVGSAGTLLRSSDGGTSWVAQSAALGAGSSELYSVHFVSATTGWVVGAGGFVKKTTNGGTTWLPQMVNTSTDLYDVYFKDANNGWIVGACGLILRTTNGGTNWDAISSAQNYNLYAVSAANANNVAAASSGTVLLRSSDSGANWSSATGVTSGSNFRAMAFSGATGWAASTGGSIWKTTNGGNVWLFWGSAAPNTGVWQAAATTTAYAYIAGLGGKLVRSAGTAVFDDFSDGITTEDLYGLQMLSDENGWAVGAGGKIFRYACAIASCPTVTTTADSGPGSLREAINCANSNPGPDTIRFNIAGVGPHVIAPLTNYVDITGDSTVIDATTQPGWTLGNIVLNGINLTNWQEPILRAWPASGTIANPNRGFELYGMVFKNAPGNALNITFSRDFKIGASGKGNVFYETGIGNAQSYGGRGLAVWRSLNGQIKHNYFGIDQALNPAVNKTGSGIGIWADSVQITDNTIGRCSNGIAVFWPGAFPDNNYPSQIYMYRNSIFGCDNGILANDHGTDIHIGSNLVADENILTNNSAGVRIDTIDNQITIALNRFNCNFGSGIYYGNATARPALPVILSGSTSKISGTAVPNAIVRVFLHGDVSCPAAPCQGNHYLGTATANASGQWVLNAPFDCPANLGANVTATATLQGITSGFATCATINSTLCNPARDRAALTTLYNSLGGGSWTIKTNWLTAAPLSDWYGVYVNNEGCVTHLDLDRNQFVGSGWTDLPPGNNLQGVLPQAIGAFSDLQWLSLAGNKGLTGVIPDTFGTLKVLNSLYMHECGINGPFPASFYNLSNLSDCDFSYNPLNMTLSPDWGKMKQMESLILSYCGIKGTIPPEMGQMDSIYILGLCCNELTGAVPATFQQLNNLQALLLGANDLSNFTNLSALDFADALPFSAYEVRVPYNRMTFEDILPNMPLTQIAPGFFTYAPQDSIFSDTTITRTAGQNLTIDLGIDASITTNVYQWFKNGNPWQTVTGVNKWDFTGLLPTDAGEYWVHVTNPNAPLLKLESYNITLVVQPNGCNATTERAALEAFYDATNGDNWTNKTNWKTNKPLYEWYGITVNNNGCVQCIDMDGDPNACFATSLANGNNLVGTLSPSVGQLQQLEQLILYKNKLTGNIPPEIGNLSKLKVLVLARNQFANSIPASLYQLTDLIILELSSNLLTGSISPQIGNLVNLDFLSLASNNLSGVIPIQIGSLLKLRILALQSNFFTGDIPTQLNQLPILYTCFLNNNRFSAAANLSVPPFIPDSIPPYFRGLRLGNRHYIELEN